MILNIDKQDISNDLYICFIKPYRITMIKVGIIFINYKNSLIHINTHELTRRIEEDFINKIKLEKKHDEIEQIKMNNLLFIQNHGYSDKYKILFCFDVKISLNIFKKSESNNHIQYRKNGDFILSCILIYDKKPFLLNIRALSPILVFVENTKEKYIEDMLFYDFNINKDRAKIIKHYISNYDYFVENIIKEYITKEKNFIYAFEDVEKCNTLPYEIEWYSYYVFNFIEDFLSKIGQKVYIGGNVTSTEQVKKVYIFIDRRIFCQIDFSAGGYLYSFSLPNVYILFFQSQIVFVFGRKFRDLLAKYKADNMIYNAKDVAYLMYKKHISGLNNKTFEITPINENDNDNRNIEYFYNSPVLLIYYGKCHVKLVSVSSNKIYHYEYKSLFFTVSSYKKYTLLLANGLEVKPYNTPIITLFFITNNAELRNSTKNIIKNFFKKESELYKELYRKFSYKTGDLVIKIDMKNTYFELWRIDNADSFILFTKIIVDSDCFNKKDTQNSSIYNFQSKTGSLEIKIKHQDEVNTFIEKTLLLCRRLHDKLCFLVYLILNDSEMERVIKSGEYVAKKEFIIMSLSHYGDIGINLFFIENFEKIYDLYEN